MLVIARAYAGEPLQRIATGSTANLTYVLHPSVASAVGITPFKGVGFPNGDVFEFEPDTYESLCRAWQTNDAAKIERAWRKATPIAQRAKEVA